MQRLVVSGSLPCSKEEAAVLAGIQLRLEECWPRARPPRSTAQQQQSGAGPPMGLPSPLTPNLTTDRSSTTRTTTDDDKVSRKKLFASRPISFCTFGPKSQYLIHCYQQQLLFRLNWRAICQRS